MTLADNDATTEQDVSSVAPSEATSPAPIQNDSPSDNGATDLEKDQLAFLNNLKDTSEAGSDDAEEETEKAASERRRNEKGQFAPDPTKEAKADTEETSAEADDEEAEDQEDVVQPVLPAPPTWNAEARELWTKLPPEAQEYIHQRERQVQTGMSRIGQQIAEYRPFSEVMQRHAATLQRYQSHPAEVMDGWLSFANDMESNPERAIAALAQTTGVDLRGMAIGDDPRRTVLDIARSAGIDLVDLALEYAGQPQQQQQVQDPRVAHLERQIEELSNGYRTIAQQQAERQRQDAQVAARRAAYEQQVHEQQVETMSVAIERFAASHSDLDAHLDAMQHLLPAIRQQNPGVSNEKILQEAYDAARWADPTTRNALIEQEAKRRAASQAKQAKEHATKARKAGAINVTGSDSSQSASMPADLQEAQKAFLRQMGLGG